MLKNLINSLLSGTSNPFESYYQRVLASSGVETAPSAQEARADYLRSLERDQRIYR